ncbi:MAG TPA: HAD-IA family hydrolase [Candidatus Binatia bacterium]|nr:HAD-IA family hydrolase [Candidatus Binatia bacterium]
MAFDLDGTLVDSRADLVAAVNHVLTSMGRAALPAETLTGFVGEGARRLVERALAPASPADVDAGLAGFMTWYGAHLLDATLPYPGIVDMLDRLAERPVVLTVLSNKPEAMSRDILTGLGLATRFADVIGGDSLPTRKPDPAGMMLLCARTGTPAEHALLVGDSVIDLRTAEAAGVGFCGVAWGLAPDGLRAAGCARMIATPAELVPIVQRIPGSAA